VKNKVKKCKFSLHSSCNRCIDKFRKIYSPECMAQSPKAQGPTPKSQMMIMPFPLSI